MKQTGEEMATRAGLPISADEARMLAVIAQRLDRRPSPVKSRAIMKERLRDLIGHLGCVQIDTISVISRSHETVLWSRLGAFDPDVFDELYYPDGALAEYWAHAAAYVPIAAMPYFRPAMERYKERYETPDGWVEREAALLARVLERIAAEGPLSSRHFDRQDERKPEAWEWYGGKPERQALDHLWSRGDLMVQRRINFQRVYDLTERIAPQLRNGEPPSREEERRFFVTNALKALGVATPEWVADYFRSGGPGYVPRKEAEAELAVLEQTGEAIPVAIEGWREQVWLAPWMLPHLDALREGKGRPTLTTFLSPFDSLIWYRPRVKRLFDFDYTLEIYIPAERRVHGYYNMPILHRGRLVGRLDPSYDRKRKVLTLKAIHLEPNVKPTESLAGAVAGAARDLAGFMGGGNIVIGATNPPLFGELLREAAGCLPVPATLPQRRLP